MEDNNKLLLVKNKRSFKKKITKFGLTALMISALSGCGIKNNELPPIENPTIEEEIEEKDNDLVYIDDNLEKLSSTSEYPGINLKNSSTTINLQSASINEPRSNIDIQEHSDNEIVEIPSLINSISFSDGRYIYGDFDNITYGDLKKAYLVRIDIKDDVSLDEYKILNYLVNCRNVEFRYYIHESSPNIWDVVDFSNYKNVENITFENLSLTSQVSFDYIKKLLNDFNHISCLSIDVNNVVIPSIDADKLYINSGIGYCTNILWENLLTYKNIEIDLNPYDSAVFFSTELISDLRNSGIEVIIRDEEEFNKINQELDAILDRINILEHDTEEEKIRKIVTEILINTEYDEEYILESESGVFGERSQIHDSNGILYPYLECGSTICKEYAAITTALARRAGLETYNLMSNVHAFNLIKINNDYYCLDVTVLDDDRDDEFSVTSSFANNEIEDIIEQPCYLYDPTRDYHPEHNLGEFDPFDRNPVFIPNDIDLKEIPDDQEIKNILIKSIVHTNEESNIDISLDKEDKKIEENDVTGKVVEFSIDGKKIIVPISIIVGILTGLGVCIKINRDKNNINRNSSRSSKSHRSYDHRLVSDERKSSLSGHYIRRNSMHNLERVSETRYDNHRHTR